VQNYPTLSTHRSTHSAHGKLAKLSLAAAVLLLTGTVCFSLSEAATNSMVVRGATAPEAASTYRVIKRPPAVGDGVGVAMIAFPAKIRTASGSLRGLFTADTVAVDATSVLQGTPAPPGFFREYRRFAHPSLNTAGDVVYRGASAGGDRGIYQGNSIAVSVVGDLVPTNPVMVPPILSGSLSRFGPPRMTDTAGAIFYVSIASPKVVVTPVGVVAINTALIRCYGGDMDCTTANSGGGFGTGTAEVLVAKNDPVPDRPGRYVCELFTDRPAVSDWGIAFRAQIKFDCGDINETALVGHFRLAYGGAIETIALEGEVSLPFVGAGGTTYATFKNASAIEDDGVVAFVAKTDGLERVENVYLCDPAVCPATYADDIVRHETLVAPGTEVKHFVEVTISNAADVSFRSRVDNSFAGKRGKGIYTYRKATGTFDRIAVKEDEVIPMTGIEYRRVFLHSTSPQGRIAFRAIVRTVGGKRTIGIYLVD